ncbi:class I SAM-dependent methyltransferase [Synechococcus sp. CS-1324]|nr:class I SAM-dependent methyltransferase [Synechococcus sp. CS-1324]PZV06084.1 MAG: class I SAM-dependent methyltransferase [Cyanobium sp.]
MVGTDDNARRRHQTYLLDGRFSTAQQGFLAAVTAKLCLRHGGSLAAEFLPDIPLDPTVADQPADPPADPLTDPLVSGQLVADQLGDGYDLVVQRLIPGYASLARLAVALLSASPVAGPAGSEVLVAGCGTGAELVEAVAQRPDWRLTALDPSAAMLSASRRRLGDQTMISWCQSNVEAFDAQDRFAGALSVLVLESLPDDGSKLAFLTALARCLQPGGQLVLVDLMRPALPLLTDQMAAAQLGFQSASGLGEERGVVESLSQGLHPIGVGRFTALVNAAGFGDPARVFQALNYEGFLLQRSS